MTSARSARPASPPVRSVAGGAPLDQPIATSVPTALPVWVDKSVALVALLILAPVMLATAIVIRLDSPGPAVFRQLRIGVDRRQGDRRRPGRVADRNGHERRQGERRRNDLRGRPFVFYKFRTMRSDARERFPELYEFEVSQEGLSRLYLQMPDDPRVSRWGRFLRRTSLDELPNFVNVLKGDMALVGPRPEMVEMAKYYDGAQRLKFRVKPGITGRAQVSGRGLLNFPDTVAQDLAYIRERSVATDLKLLLRTVVAMVNGSGAF
jgi:lipopolysaccharide/colanic/teichoic acid biosynthesis glycosyltransferase